MSSLQLIVGSLAQFVVFFIVCWLCWLGHRLIARLRSRPHEPMRQWLGLVGPTARWRDAALLVLGILLFGELMRWGESLLGVGSVMDAIADSSPGAQCAALPTAAGAISAALAYAFIQTGGAEELFMRGLLYRRFISWFGYRAANLLQALLFALLHNLIVHLGIDDAPLWMHATVFVNLFVFSYAIGWYMEKRDGGSLFMPWMVHGIGNFKTFLYYWLG